MSSLAHGLLLPPGLNFLLLAIGFLFLFMLPRFGHWCLFFGILLLYLFSIAPVAEFLIRTLEDTPALVEPIEVKGEKAIVVLGADRYHRAPEYGDDDTAGEHALVRLRYARRLQDQTDLPILISGGRPRGEKHAEAELMAEVLQETFHGGARWLEEASADTFANAVCSRKILKAEAADTIFLITHAAHMPRALYSFEAVGLKVTPAPTGYVKDSFAYIDGAVRWWPSMDALRISRYALHEWLGLTYYNIIYSSANAIKAVQVQC